jgi:hypothetical protein
VLAAGQLHQGYDRAYTYRASRTPQGYRHP